MNDLSIDTIRVVNFEFNFKTNVLNVSGLDDNLIEHLKLTINAEPCEKIDFISSLNDELYHLEKELGKIRIEQEVSIKDIGLRYFIIKGIYDGSDNLFKGMIVDDTSNYILNQKAIQAEKLRSIGALTGGIAHDFNNQLMVISGSCELLKRYITDAKLCAYLKNIEDSARNSSELINKLLTFSHVDKIPKKQFDLIKCMDDTISILEHTSNKKITIMYDCFIKSMKIHGNFGLIQNALLNICKNAIESILGDGLIMIRTTSVHLDELPNDIINNEIFSDGKYACIEIKDNGCGMDELTINKIFDPFFTTKGFDKGTGLGLSTVIGTIESHNGLIGVTSELGRGTTFSIYFKLIKGVEVEMVDNKKNIMVIDDEYLVRMVLQDILIDLGYNVICFESGIKAVEYYEVNIEKVDLVLCDMMMPEMTGREVLENLSKINSDLKLIILSGYSNDNISDLGPNVIQYLTKPIMLNSLGEVIENALK